MDFDTGNPISSILCFCSLGAQNGCRNENMIFFVRAMAVPMAIHSHWHIHCRSRADSHSHGHRQSYGGRALGLSHSDCHRRSHGNEHGCGNSGRQRPWQWPCHSRGHGQSQRLGYDSYDILYDFCSFSVAATIILGKIQMLLNTYRF